MVFPNGIFAHLSWRLQWRNEWHGSTSKGEEFGPRRLTTAAAGGVWIGWEMTKCLFWPQKKQSQQIPVLDSVEKFSVYSSRKVIVTENHRFSFWRNMTLHCSVSSITATKKQQSTVGRRQTGWFSECDLWDLFSHFPKTQFLALILVWFQIISLEWSGMTASVQQIAFAMARITLVPMQHMPTEKKVMQTAGRHVLRDAKTPRPEGLWSIFNLAQQSF